MRVLFVISGLGLGGAERQVVLLSREMVRLGHAVAIYTLTRETPRADELAGSSVELTIDQKRMRLDPALLLRLRRCIVDWAADVVHGFLYDGNLYARLAAAGLDVPVLDSERNDNYRLSPLQRAGYRLTAGFAHGVVANSYAGAAFAQRLHRVPATRTHVVWNGIDEAEIHTRLALSLQPAHQVWPGPDMRRLCVVGSIRPSKDYLLALQTMRRLIDRDPSWRLSCIGDSLSGDGSAQGYKAEVLAECTRLGLGPFVKFLGHRRDVPELVASSDVLLVTSVHEGFPNVVLEGMACGTPVISTNYSDVRRILPKPWQVVDSRAADDLAQAILRCCTEREDVVAAQRQWVRAHASVGASAAAMLSVYGCYLSHAAGARERAC